MDDVVTLADQIMPGAGETFRGTLESFADVQPDAADATMCQAISLGLAFDAVDATFNL